MSAITGRKTKSLVEKGLVSLSLFDGIVPNDFVFEDGEIVTICGDKGAGKTTLMAALATQQMLPPNAWWQVERARQEADYLRTVGYKKAVVPKDVKHLVYSEFPLKTCNDQGYLSRPAHVLDFDRMLLPNGINNAQFFPLGAWLVIDEFMAKFAARGYIEGKAMPKEMREMLQVIRHRKIKIITSSLQATGSDKGIRDMSQTYILIVHRTEDEYKNLPRTTWYVLAFDNDKSCAKFRENPHRNDISYVPYIFVHNGDIHKCVDSEGKNDRFLVGMENREIEFKNWEVA